MRILTIVDTFSGSRRRSSAVQLRGADVVEVLERVCSEVGYPKHDPGRPGHANSSRATSICGPTRRRHARLQPARQADRQRLHRKLQRQVPGGVPEPHWFMSLDEARSENARLGVETTTRCVHIARSATSRRYRW